VINDILGLNIRTFFPVSATQVNVTVWGAGFSNESREERAARINGLISFIGPGGFGTPDDVEILESCQRAYAHRPWATAIFPGAWGQAPSATPMKNKTAVSGVNGAVASGNRSLCANWPSLFSQPLSPTPGRSSTRTELGLRGEYRALQGHYSCAELPDGPIGPKTCAPSAR
jgi:hypothetical protein